MALSSGSRSFLSELTSWTAAAALLAAAYINYDTLRAMSADALGLAATPVAAEREEAAPDIAPALALASGTEEIKAGPDGHYYAQAEINGRDLDVMVDTGASMVALTYEDAERAGLRLRSSDFTGRVSTANGTAAVAPVTLDRISIGAITIRDVRAAVAEPGRLQKTLLGMSFLSRLERVDIRQGRLLLVE